MYLALSYDGLRAAGIPPGSIYYRGSGMNHQVCLSLQYGVNQSKCYYLCGKLTCTAIYVPSTYVCKLALSYFLVTKLENASWYSRQYCCWSLLQLSCVTLLDSPAKEAAGVSSTLLEFTRRATVARYVLLADPNSGKSRCYATICTENICPVMKSHVIYIQSAFNLGTQISDKRKASDWLLETAAKSCSNLIFQP